MTNRLTKPSAAKETYICVTLLSFNVLAVLYLPFLQDSSSSLVPMKKYQWVYQDLFATRRFVRLISCCVHTFLLSGVTFGYFASCLCFSSLCTFCLGVKWCRVWCVLILCSSYHQNQGTVTHDIMIDSEAGCVVCSSSLPSLYLDRCNYRGPVLNLNYRNRLL